MILQNEIRCLECGDQIYSQHRHDFRHCECGACAVDGGQDYLRRLGKPERIVDLSIIIADEDVEGLKDIIEDTKNNWNSLGKVCAIARYLRDEVGINIGERE